MVSDFTSGTLLALGAAVLFGAHTSFSKTKSVIESGVAMPIYNIYFLIGAAITCFIEYVIMFIIGAEPTFTYLGIICAILLLCFEVFLLLSIQQIGVGYATGFSVFSAAIVTPILQVILNQPIAIWWIMVIGLAMLATAVFTMSILRDALKCLGFYRSKISSMTNEQEVALEIEQNEQQVAMVTAGHQHGEELATLDEHSPLMANHGGGKNHCFEVEQQEQEAGGQEIQISKCQMALGLVFSSLAGIFMAVLPLPSLYAEPSSAGLNFFLSFGIGCLIVIPLSGIIVVFTGDGHDEKGSKSGRDSRSVIPYNLLYKLISFDDEVWHFKQVVIPAVSAGIVWSIGNICGFCSFLYLSYTVAVSFVQCNVIVAMFLGVVLWKEITNKLEIFILFLLSLYLVGGCAVVVYGVFGSF